ncbi:MAG TPA: SDR family oxidoreductase [Vicinamibacterales bacterium]|nr:SDR family oxidoreductase [Vicinamibacterales bacterium]
MTHESSITPTQGRTALITGASAGIGAAFAEVFASNGFNLVITARRQERLQAIGEQMRSRYGVKVAVIAADHARRDTPRDLCDAIEQTGMTVDALVNNAGYGIPGSYLSSPWERHEAMLQVMVVGLAELTHLLLPGMLQRGYGRIINVASLAGLVPAPAGHTLYAASKALVIKFSEALAHEVRGKGVNVTALCPGFTFSEFHDVTGTREQMKQLPSWMWMDAPTVARQGYDAVMAGTPIYINGRVNRGIEMLVRYVPQTLVRYIGRQVGRAYRKT